MKIFSYIRVSGLGQVEKDGPIRQREAVLSFCKTQALSPATPLYEFFEQGVSGTVEAMDRPAFAEMIQAVDTNNRNLENSPIEAIVVERLDRLARDLMVSEFLLAECRKRNVKVYAADQGVLIDMASDGGDPTRKLIRQLLAALAEWDKSMIVKKLRAARVRAGIRDGHCEGKKPFGYTGPERVVKELIKNLSASGWSLKMIATSLNEEGYKTKHGKAWNRGNVYTVLSERKQKHKLKLKGKISCAEHTSNS